MVDKRNRILNLVKYIESQGIEVNIGKNKARGNKGYFKTDGKFFRIDIAKNQSDEAILKTLAHEFAHYVHYRYDKTLNSLDFVFNDLDMIEEELLSITVELIPKTSVEPFFKAKDKLKSEIKILSDKLKKYDFEDLERKIKKTQLKYLLKHDKVKVLEGIFYKLYSIDELKQESDFELYVILKSRQRALKRINSKISRLNKYYNSPTELFARSFELYVTEPNKLLKIAPNVFKEYENITKSANNTLLSDFVKNLL